jgi:regulatory protein
VVKKYVSLKEVLQKIKAFCAYQERCHLEVKGKLFDFGLSVNEVDKIVGKHIITHLQNFFNEKSKRSITIKKKYNQKNKTYKNKKYDL